MTDTIEVPNPELAKILTEVRDELQRQHKKGFDIDHDFDLLPADWNRKIKAYADWALEMYEQDSPEKYRRRMMQVAALAVAHCAVLDAMGGSD